MKKNKKLISILLTMTIMFTLIVPAIADEIGVDYKEHAGETVLHDVYKKDSEENLKKDNQEIGEKGQKDLSVNEKVELKTMKATQAEPLKLIDQSPSQGATDIDEKTEIYLIFNKPVEIATDIKEKKRKARIWYDAKFNKKPDDKFGKWKYDLIVDEKDPRRVSVKLDDDNGNKIFLEKNHLYKILIGENIIKDKESDERYEGIVGIDGWRFSTVGEEISIYTDRKSVIEGFTLQLEARLKEEMKDEKVVFYSSDHEIATVDENGLVKGLKPGKVTITAELEKDSSKKCEIEIAVAKFIPYSMKINAPKNVFVGDKVKLVVSATETSARLEIKDYSDHVIFTSSDTEIADFDKDGFLVAKKSGIVKITAQSIEKPEVTCTADIEIGKKSNYQLATKWAYDGYVFPAVTSDGSAYILSNGKIIALDGNGYIKEDFVNPQIDSPAKESIVVAKMDGEEYLIVKAENTLMVVHPKTGKLEWKVALKEKIEAGPVVDSNSGNIYVITYESDGIDAGRTLYALNKNDNKYLWRNKLNSEHSSGKHVSMIHDETGKIYIIFEKSLFVFDGRTGDKLWEYENNKKFTGKVVIGSNGVGYVVDGKKLYAADFNEKNIKCIREFNNILSVEPILSKDQNHIYISAENEIGRNLFKLNTEGDIQEKYVVGGKYGIFGEDGYLYTNTNIYDENLNVIAYYDQTLGNKPRDEFFIGKDNTMYRLLRGEYVWQIMGIQAVKLCDSKDKQVYDIQVMNQLSYNMFPRDKIKVIAGAVNKDGAFLQDVDLLWESDDTTVADVVYGDITAKNTGTANIIIKVKDQNISKKIKVNVQESPIPKRMYFLYDNVKNSEKENKIIGYSGESLPLVNIFVEDQYGNFMEKQPVTWSTSTPGIVGYNLYEGGSGTREIKYQALLSSGNTGETILKASLDHYPGVYCEIPIQIKPKRSEMLWETQIEYDMTRNDKSCYHIMDQNGNIYYTTKNEVASLKKENGDEIWKTQLDINSINGLNDPKIDENGNMYIYEKYSEYNKKNHKVWVVDSKDGKVLYEKEFKGIENLQIGNKHIYLLTIDNKLYQLNKELNQTWNSPLEVGNNYGMCFVNGKLYISNEDKIYSISEDGKMELVYEDEHTELWIEDYTNDGNLIIQKNCLGKYSLISINDQGKENWKYEKIRRKVRVGVDQEGNVYAVEKTVKKEKEIYFLNKEGIERVRTILQDPSLLEGECKPVIDKNGTVYITTNAINALSSNGEILWKAELLGPFITYTPNSITIDDEGIVYVGATLKGVVALKGKQQKGVQLSINGKENMDLNTLKDLKIELMNYEEQKNIIFKTTLEDIDTHKMISETYFEDEMKKDTLNSYKLGIKTPKQGNIKVKLEVLDRENSEVIVEDEIILQK